MILYCVQGTPLSSFRAIVHSDSPHPWEAGIIAILAILWVSKLSPREVS